MAAGANEMIVVACPCCGAKLTVDPALKAVIHHEVPPRPAGPTKDLGAALAALKEEAQKRREQFQQASEAEKGKTKVLEKRFQEALKKAKDEPIERPVRDFDLD
jgi:hypothetical protein